MKIFEIEEVKSSAKIKVVGVGGGGGNAVNGMIAAGLQGIEFIVVNTDLQAIDSSLAHQKVQIGAGLTKGLGAGAYPEVGKQAALDDKGALANAVKGADMLFITAGMGGGTGTGASPVIAEAARELGILTVGVVTKPFLFEGSKRARNAEEGIKELKKYVDAIIVIQNHKLLNITDKNVTWLEGFRLANDVLRQAIKGISDLILVPGLINLDFADIRTIIKDSGKALMGIGSSGGNNNKAEFSAKTAISSPLLEETSIGGAKRVLINITGGPSLSLHEVSEASSLIRDAVHEDANIIFGSVIDPDLDDEIVVTVIATGFEEKPQAVMTSYEKWTPSKEALTLKGSGKILSKQVQSAMSLDENTLDVPTFLRKGGLNTETDLPV